MQTMSGIAHQLLKEEEQLTFEDLWEKVSQRAEVCKNLSDSTKKQQFEKKAEFYKLLILNGKFIRLKNGLWTLVELQPFETLQQLKGFYATEVV